MTPTDARELLTVAARLCEDPGPDLAGRWPRAVAIITRAALEACLDDYWRRRAPGVADSPARPKMLCLPMYFADADEAHNAYQTWARLSAACHRHAYDPDPTA